MFSCLAIAQSLKLSHRWQSPRPCDAATVLKRRCSGYLSISNFWPNWALGNQLIDFCGFEKNSPMERGCNWKRRLKNVEVLLILRGNAWDVMSSHIFMPFLQAIWFTYILHMKNAVVEGSLVCFWFFYQNIVWPPLLRKELEAGVKDLAMAPTAEDPSIGLTWYYYVAHNGRFDLAEAPLCYSWPWLASVVMIGASATVQSLHNQRMHLFIFFLGSQIDGW